VLRGGEPQVFVGWVVGLGHTRVGIRRLIAHSSPLGLECTKQTGNTRSSNTGGKASKTSNAPPAGSFWTPSRPTPRPTPRGARAGAGALQRRTGATRGWRRRWVQTVTETWSSFHNLTLFTFGTVLSPALRSHFPPTPLQSVWEELSITRGPKHQSTLKQVLLDQLICERDAAALEAEWGQAEGLAKEGAAGGRLPWPVIGLARRGPDPPGMRAVNRHTPHLIGPLSCWPNPQCYPAAPCSPLPQHLARCKTSTRQA
jgi:hypothetical protein